MHDLPDTIAEHIVRLSTMYSWLCRKLISKVVSFSIEKLKVNGQGRSRGGALEVVIDFEESGKIGRDKDGMLR